ncbi:MAG: GIY-YIG nuclease family protein [Tyzzerella sp.]|nr:GIY-YIG nuclease family protein [Tyzzerella sp.]
MGLGDIFKINQFKSEIAYLNAENANLRVDIQNLKQKLDELGAFDYYALKEVTNAMSIKEQELLQCIDTKNHELEKLIKQVKTQTNKLSRSKELVRAIDYALAEYFYYSPEQRSFKITPEQLMELEEISPSIILKLHCMDMKDLRKAYRDNDKQINAVLDKYAARYTTKANQAIYKLMVIALRAELQNILYNLKYEKLDKSIEDVKTVTQKYLKIAGDGNQSIVGTLTKFIGEIEYLFINAVKIEYNYYVKKEQARQEQLAIKEQMKQEAEERKALEAERKKVEQEENKFNTQIEKLKEQLVSAKDAELEKLNARILELQSQLAEVVVKKEEIAKLANGKAGNVYIISNLGSFGENVFKIGMTRRLNPQDRVNELGDASVPFRFDVHSFIFSDDAVGLENKLHTILNDKRVNKVNLRKEFFRTTIDELETLVNEIEPTAEFNKTMLAEEFRQSLSNDEIYSTDYILEDDSENE